jgi:hypothetical protein
MCTREKSAMGTITDQYCRTSDHAGKGAKEEETSGTKRMEETAKGGEQTYEERKSENEERAKKAEEKAKEKETNAAE